MTRRAISPRLATRIRWNMRGSSLRGGRRVNSPHCTEAAPGAAAAERPTSNVEHRTLNEKTTRGAGFFVQRSMFNVGRSTFLLARQERQAGAVGAELGRPGQLAQGQHAEVGPLGDQ